MQGKIKSTIIIMLDIILINLSYYLACYLRFDGVIDKEYIKIYVANVIAIMLIKIVVFYFFKLYSSLWKYASVEEIIQIVEAAFVGNICVLSYLYLQKQHLPRSLFILTGIMDVILIGGVRFAYRAIRRIKNKKTGENSKMKKVMIIGAGDAGATIIKELRNNRALNAYPAAIIDDDENKEGRRINRVPVLGQRLDIASVAKKQQIDEIIIAIPSASKQDIKAIVEECKRTNCKLKILPAMHGLVEGEVSISDIRDVQIEDLLGRAQVELDTNEICDYLKGKKVLVTGGGGSIGSELCRQIAKFEPSQLVILDIYENNAYDLQMELNRLYRDNELNFKVIIASVRDKQKIERVMEDVRPDVIFHAAAHKHVPLMEDNPKEAVKNNVFGTLNVAQAADKYGVKKFVMISTDKAVNPTNVMGATKRNCEMIIQSINKISKTEYVAVRFGNVLGSNGSVIPLFKRQIAEGGPVTVTHKDIIRYFMTIPEAAQLVMQAGAMAKGGEIFILDMGEPVKIIDLARDLIKLSGFDPDVDMPIKVTGLRPGEKLFEELLMDEEGIEATIHKKIFVGRPTFTDYKLLMKLLEKYKVIIDNGTEEELKEYLGQVVPTYKKENIRQKRASFKHFVESEIAASNEVKGDN